MTGPSATPTMGELRGAVVARHFGDTAAEYDAATTGVAMRDRSHRGRWLVEGRQPSAMLKGVVTGRMPDGWTERGDGVRVGRAEYSVVLTPKGRTLSDLRIWRLDGSAEDDATLLLDVPPAGREALGAHLRRFLPPRLAAVSDATASTALLSVVGPRAAETIARRASSLRLDASDLEAMAEGDLFAVEGGGGWPLTIVRSGSVSPPAWDLVGARSEVEALEETLAGAGVTRIGSGVWETLRIEAGRPAFGAELTDQVIPIEAGVQARAIDYEKGCYTGQEVIIRLRDRGHVNRHLRRIRLPEGPTPATGTQLWRADGEKAVGVITSSAMSPRMGPLALGYVRREVAVPGAVRVGGADGPEARVEELEG